MRYTEEQAKVLALNGFNMVDVTTIMDDEPFFAIGVIDNEVSATINMTEEAISLLEFASHKSVCEVCGAIAVTKIIDFCVFERNGIIHHRPSYNSSHYYCKSHERDPEEVIPKKIDIERFSKDGN